MESLLFNHGEIAVSFEGLNAGANKVGGRTSLCTARGLEDTPENRDLANSIP